jgi:hypothetical protein
MQKKICSKCLIEKDVSEFYSDKRKNDIVRNLCDYDFVKNEKV